MIESGSEFHPMAALCLKVSLPISDLGLGNSIFMDFLRQRDDCFNITRSFNIGITSIVGFISFY